MNTLDSVLEILAGVTGSAQLRQHPDLRLYDLHLLDSFKTIELMLELSDRLGVDLTPAEFDREEWATPRAIAAYLEHKIGNGTS